MKLSKNGKKFIQNFEGLRLESYQCTSHKWTIGFGHTANVKAGDRINKQQAEAYFNADVAKFENVVNSGIKIKINQNEFDALVSLAFNIGAEAFKESTLLKFLNSGNRKATAEQFAVWRLSGGKVSHGLVKRRQREKELFLKCV